MTETFPQSDTMLALIARRFRMLSEPYRLRLLQLLESGEKTVTEMVNTLDGNQPNVSKHLQLLHDSGLVSRRREGTSIYYGIADPMVLSLCEMVCRNTMERARQELDELNDAQVSSAQRSGKPKSRKVGRP